MNPTLWQAVVTHDYSIPLNFEEGHPAYSEGYYAFSTRLLVSNPHEYDSDSWYEWEDGYLQAYNNSLNREH